MKESEIWYEVGRRMETRTCKSTNARNGITFLCCEFAKIWTEVFNNFNGLNGYIMANKRYKEFATIDKKTLYPEPYAYNDPLPLEENHEGRTLAAYLFALIAAKEEEKLL